MLPRVSRLVPAATALLLCVVARAEEKAAHSGDEKPAAKTAKELVRKQEPMSMIPEEYSRATPESTRIVINLAAQRLKLMSGDKQCLETPISSGKRAAPTPTGAFAVLEKIKVHEASTYGSFVDKAGRAVRTGISMKLDAAPAGTHYAADPMPFFCRFTATGFGVHAGHIPGYPAAHGSVRVPEDAARFIFEKVRVGTPIEIVAE